MLLEGKKVFVGPFLKRTERPVDKEQHYTNVFVKNLSENVSDEELEKMFNEHGTVWIFIFRQSQHCLEVLNALRLLVSRVAEWLLGAEGLLHRSRAFDG